MAVTSNMSVSAVSATKWHLTSAYAGQANLNLFVSYTKGVEVKYNLSIEVQYGTTWYSVSQTNSFGLTVTSESYMLMSLVKAATAFRLVVEAMVAPEADMASLGNLDLRGILN